jgi:diacylglycerol kinase (ATP)
MSRRVHVVANPAAGQDSLNIKLLNDLFKRANIEWEILFTKEAGDGYRLAKQALEANVDVVAAFGGDGTVAEVASGLVGSDVPFAIFPGGTANVMSIELGIPSDFAEACALLCADEVTTRPLDVGQVDDRHFLLRVSTGIEAKMVAGADRELKNRMGTLAYGLSALRALREPEVVHYRFTVDGEVMEEDGVACIIANSGNLGLPGLRLAPNIEVGDGLLDLIIVNKTNLAAAIALVTSIFGQGEVETPVEVNHGSQNKLIHHMQAREIRIETMPSQEVQADGEIIGETPKEIRILPGAVRVIVPQLPLPV